MVGIDVLLQLVHGAQADHRPTTEPEGRHRPVLLMQTHEELVQTASGHDVLQVAIPDEAENNGCESDVNSLLYTFDE